jgi:hypothetical protein
VVPARIDTLDDLGASQCLRGYARNKVLGREHASSAARSRERVGRCEMGAGYILEVLYNETWVVGCRVKNKLFGRLSQG